MLRYFAFIVAFSLATAPAPQEQTLASRRLPESAPPLTYQLPTDGFGLLIEVAGIASAAKVPAGIELAPVERREGLQRIRENHPVTYSGRSVGEALDLAVSSLPDYAWSESRGIISLRSRTLTDSFLDRAVPAFDFENGNVAMAVSAVHRIFDPAFPEVRRVNTGSGFMPQPGTPEYEAAVAADEAAFSRRFSVSRQNSTVREILNAIVMAHGEGVWIVQFGRLPADYRSAAIGFQSFSGRRLMLASRQ